MAKSRAEKEKEIRILLAGYDQKHLRRVLSSRKAIDEIYDAVAQEAARIGVATGFDDPAAPFYLSDFPQARKRIDELVGNWAGKMQSVVEQGSKNEWLLSAAKNAAMINALAKGTGIPKETIEKWKEPNLSALKAFQKRKLGNGMGLSERVWNLGQQMKQELELALDIGLGEGKSAADMSRDVRKFLREPSKLFRRVRDKHGNLRLSRAAAAYHPGLGVYRSSYKNAIRLTATETNMAYRTADHDKWGQLDFVIGIKVQLSNNHTINGKPFHDMCDELAGTYPKEFKFVGWHPLCRCFATPVLADWEEQLRVMKMQKDGMDVSDYHYKGEVTETPKGFNDWMEKNAERIENAKSVPYFIKDNPEYAVQASGVDIEAKMGNQEASKDAGAHKYGGGVKNKEAIKDEDSMLDVLFKEDAEHPIKLTEDVASNNVEVAATLGIPVPQKTMMHHVANCGNVNPDLNFVGGEDNCALCSFTYELRRRGFDVKAKVLMPTDKSSNAWIAGENYKELWTHIEHKTAKANNGKTVIESLNKVTKNVGRYHLEWDWNAQKGHNIVAIRLQNKQLVLYDAQLQFYYSPEEYFRGVKEIGVYRADTATVNTKVLDSIVEKVRLKKRRR